MGQLTEITRKILTSQAELSSNNNELNELNERSPSVFYNYSSVVERSASIILGQMETLRASL